MTFSLMLSKIILQYTDYVHILSFSFFFQEALALAKENIGMAIVKNSLYGYLFCMRNLLLDCDLR